MSGRDITIEDGIEAADDELAVLRFALEAELLVEPEGRKAIRRVLGGPEMDESAQVTRDRAAGSSDGGVGEGGANNLQPRLSLAQQSLVQTPDAKRELRHVIRRLARRFTEALGLVRAKAFRWHATVAVKLRPLTRAASPRLPVNAYNSGDRDRRRSARTRRTGEAGRDSEGEGGPLRGPMLRRSLTTLSGDRRAPHLRSHESVGAHAAIGPLPTIGITSTRQYVRTELPTDVHVVQGRQVGSVRGRARSTAAAPPRRRHIVAPVRRPPTTVASPLDGVAQNFPRMGRVSLGEGGWRPRSANNRRSPNIV